MPEEKKTEEQLRHDIRRKYNFSEERDKERIDGFLEEKKNRYTATKQKNKAQEDLEEFKKTGNPNKGTQETTEAKKPDYSLQDIRALGKVHDDDVDRVTKFAKSNDVSIAKALKDDDLKAILSSREEKRKTAEATNTGKGKRGTSKVSDETVLKDFEDGKPPAEDDDAGIKKLAEGRMAHKKSLSRTNNPGT